MSEFLVKQRLIDWLITREKLYEEYHNIVSKWTVGAIIREIESGHFDWSGEGD